MINITNGIITITKGDSAYLDFILTAADGIAYDMQEGDTLRMTVRVKADASSPVLLEATSDTSTIVLTPEMTTTLDPGKYSYDVQLQTAAGDVFTIIGAQSINTLLRNFVVCPEVTV